MRTTLFPTFGLILLHYARGFTTALSSQKSTTMYAEKFAFWDNSTHEQKSTYAPDRTACVLVISENFAPSAAASVAVGGDEKKCDSASSAFLAASSPWNRVILTVTSLRCAAGIHYRFRSAQRYHPSGAHGTTQSASAPDGSWHFRCGSCDLGSNLALPSA